MGLSFQGKTSGHPVVIDETEGISYSDDVQGDPEADLRRFREFLAFDQYLDTSKL